MFMLKYLAAGLAAAVGLASFAVLLWALALQPFLDSATATAGERLAESLQQAGSSAWQLGQSFQSLSPPAGQKPIGFNPGSAALAGLLPGELAGAAGVNPAFSPGAAGAAGGEEDSAPAAGAAGVDPAGAPAVAPTFTPTPLPTLPPEEYPVARALSALARLQSYPPGDPRQAQAAAQLAAAWEPRYTAADRDYKRFMADLAEVQKLAADYFRIQGDLTAALQDPELRAAALEGDRRERRIWAAWQEQAQRTRRQARAIKQDLDDMNVLIAKLRLSADFGRLQNIYLQLPDSMLALEAELGEFERQRRRALQVGWTGAAAG